MNLFGRSKVPVILQLSNTECGIASLAMIFSYYKVNIPIEELRDQCGVTRDGCKAQTLIDVAHHYGFEAAAYTIDIDTIRGLTEPVIAHWKFSHYVVINYVSNNKVSINDPAHGTIDIDIGEFDRSFTGVILNISPTNKIVKSKRSFSPMKLFTEWLSGFYIEILFLLLCLLIATITPYLNSRIYNFFIDQFIIARNNHFLWYILGISTLLSIILISVSYASKCMEFRLNTKVSILKSSNIISHVLKLPMLFYSLRQRSEIISSLSRTELIISSLIENSIKIIAGFTTALICFTLMMKIDYLLAILSIATTLLFIFIFYILSKITFYYEKSHINIHGKFQSHSTFSISNIETIKACSLEDRVTETWLGLFIRKIVAQDKINSLITATSVLMKSYSLVLLYLILIVGSNRVFNGMITIGNLMAYYLLNLFCNTSITSAFKSLIDTQTINAQYARINDILLYKKDLRHINCHSQKIYNSENCIENHEVISCVEVKFHYNINTPPSLDNININIKRNEHIAFIGSTGSGKSTLVKLLCALYQPNGGEIKLFGKPLSSYSANELSNLFAYVSQEVTLFSGTILHNLTLSRETATLEDVYQAIDTACLSDFIAERGLQGIVNEGGNNVSGGEKQRLEIARALLQNTPILILDEATSALDYKTEAALIANLKRLNKTIIFVAHRLSTIEHCNQILTLSNGKIINHEQQVF